MSARAVVGSVSQAAGVIALLALSAAPVRALSSPTLATRPLYSAGGYSPEQPFQRPVSVALSEANRVLYVADPADHKVIALSLQGVPGFTIEVGKHFDPVSAAVGPGGRLFVADRAAAAIRIFSSSGDIEAELPLAELGEGQPVRVGRITLDAAGKLYVVDQGNCQVLVFDENQQLKLRIGRRGGEKGQFKLPEDVAVDRFGRIYVTDSLGTPIQVFDSSGKYFHSIGRHGEGPEDLNLPTALFIDRFDQVWLVDTYRHKVIVFTSFGLALRHFGEFGQAIGRLYYPVDVAVDGLGRIYLVEAEGRRLQVFAFDNPLEPFRR